MQFEIMQPGSFALLKINLDANETVKAESDAMMSMSSNIVLKSKMEGGLLGGLARSLLSGESLFFQTLTAQDQPGEVVLAPALPGDVTAYQLSGKTLYIQSGGFLAAESSVEIDTKMQNLGKGLFSGAGLFVIKVHGTGTVFFNSFGAIVTKELQAGEEYIVDTGHLVAWEESMDYKIQKASSGLMTSITSGECLVCKFTGPGKVYLQSRNPSSFGAWVRGYLPEK
jgi:uncharacterized protein (TIGR00266 family)